MSDRDTEANSRAVRHFYEGNPYPPPVADLEDVRRLWQDPARRRADHHLHWPARAYSEAQSILVAGCGTSQAARYALRQPKAQVIGIDVSPTSIRHTESLKDRHALSNLEVRVHPIERVGELGRRFDRVVCTGVLHHLADPDAGLRALSDVLKPDGAMHLMVYASYGRAGVYMLQDYCRRLGIGTTDAELRDLADTLMSLPEGHPLAHLLAHAPDFRSRAGLADALLHPNDRAYSVAEFLDFIDRAGLHFQRWVRQAPYLPQCGDPGTTPHRDRLLRLAPAERYAALELLRGTMVRHSAIVSHRDGSEDGGTVRFDSDDWLDFVPIRLPDTVCVRDRPPRGAAAVLINKGHSYGDLFLPIDRVEKKLFDAIDGHRTTAGIMQLATGPQRQEQARAFFERLWWYDQVVFDTSRRIAGGNAEAVPESGRARSQ